MYVSIIQSMKDRRIRITFDGVEGLHDRQLIAPQIDLAFKGPGGHNIKGALGTVSVPEKKGAKFFQCVLNTYISQKRFRRFLQPKQIRHRQTE